MRIFKIKYLLTILISIISIMPMILMVDRNSTNFYDKTNLNTKNNLVINERISIGSDYFGFIDWKGYLYTWGDNEDGQLGHGNLIDLDRPKKVLGLSILKEISLGSSSSAAITESGDLYTWGKNEHGQLGHGNLIDLDEPKKVSGLSNLKEISFGSSSSTAITESGDLYTWGDNQYGQLGHGDLTDINAPKKVLGLNDVKEVSIGLKHSVAITESGDLYTWGNNDYGQLGHGDTTNIDEPKQVLGLNNVKEVSRGSGYLSAVITESGDLYTWGNNEYGQLGHGNLIDLDEPKQVLSLYNVKEISVGFYHSSAITDSGHLYTWGNNSYGQLGHGGTQDTHIPKKIEGLNNVEEVSVNGVRSAAITNSGDLYTWGNYVREPNKMIGLPHQPTIEWMDDVIHPIWYLNNGGQIGFKYMIQLLVGDIIDPKATYTLFKNDIEIRSEEFDLEFNVTREVLINNLEEGNYSLKVQLFKYGLPYFEDKLQETITLTKESIENPENEVIGSEIHEDNENIFFTKNSLNVKIKGKLGSVDSFEFVAKNIDGSIISTSPAIKIFIEKSITIFALKNDWSFGREQDFHINLKGSLGDSVFETQKIYTYEFLGFDLLDSSNFNILIMVFLIIIIMILSNGTFFYFVIKNNKETKLLISSINESGDFLNDDYDEDFESSL